MVWWQVLLVAFSGIAASFVGCAGASMAVLVRQTREPDHMTIDESGLLVPETSLQQTGRLMFEMFTLMIGASFALSFAIAISIVVAIAMCYLNFAFSAAILVLPVLMAVGTLALIYCAMNDPLIREPSSPRAARNLGLFANGFVEPGAGLSEADKEFIRGRMEAVWTNGGFDDMLRRSISRYGY